MPTIHILSLFSVQQRVTICFCVWFSVGSDKLYHQWLSTVRVSTRAPARHPELGLCCGWPVEDFHVGTETVNLKAVYI